MSASEKLRALGLALQTDTPLNYGRVDSLNTLGDALPQIVAVVEAAEKMTERLNATIQPDLPSGFALTLTRALVVLEKELT